MADNMALIVLGRYDNQADTVIAQITTASLSKALHKRGYHTETVAWCSCGKHRDSRSLYQSKVDIERLVEKTNPSLVILTDNATNAIAPMCQNHLIPYIVWYTQWDELNVAASVDILTGARVVVGSSHRHATMIGSIVPKSNLIVQPPIIDIPSGVHVPQRRNIDVLSLSASQEDCINEYLAIVRMCPNMRFAVATKTKEAVPAIENLEVIRWQPYMLNALARAKVYFGATKKTKAFGYFEAQALAVGTKVFLTDTGCLRMFVKRKKYGVVMPPWPQKLASWAELLVKLVARPQPDPTTAWCNTSFQDDTIDRILACYKKERTSRWFSVIRRAS